MDKNVKTGLRYSAEEKAAAVRMVSTLRVELGTDRGTAQRGALQLGYGIESVRSWVRQDEIDDGLRGGVTSDGVAPSTHYHSRHRAPAARALSDVCCLGSFIPSSRKTVKFAGLAKPGGRHNGQKLISDGIRQPG